MFLMMEGFRHMLSCEHTSAAKMICQSRLYEFLSNLISSPHVVTSSFWLAHHNFNSSSLSFLLEDLLWKWSWTFGNGIRQWSIHHWPWFYL